MTSSTAPRVIVTGGAAAFHVRDFLTRSNVPFEYRDSDPQAQAGVAVCTLDDGTCLVAPTLPELAERLGLMTAPSPNPYDLAVIGGGPAGLAAAVYGASEGLKVAVIERAAPGGQAGTSASIENYLGFPDGISGAELSARARDQAVKFGADLLVLREVVEGQPGDDGLFRSVLSDGTILASRSVLCSTGVDWRRLEGSGVDRLLQAGVYYGSAISEAPGLVGKDVLVIGGGNSAGQAAMNFSLTARSVTIVVRGDHLAASMSTYLIRRIADAGNVHVRTNAEVTGVEGETWLTAVSLKDRRSGQVEVVPAGAMFVCIGGAPRTAWASEAGLAVDPGGYLVAGRDILDRDLTHGTSHWTLDRDPYPLETSQPGLFVAGDVRHGSTKRVSTAVGEGAMAIGLVHRFLADSPLP